MDKWLLWSTAVGDDGIRVPGTHGGEEVKSPVTHDGCSELSHGNALPPPGIGIVRVCMHSATKSFADNRAAFGAYICVTTLTIGALAAACLSRSPAWTC